MSSFAIVAEFPLGTYRGRQTDGRVDRLPSPARLHAALLNAAAQGVRAELDRDRLHPCPADREALAWVESHPPDALGLPRSLLNEGRTEAYRPEGFFGVRDKRRVHETRRDPLGTVALAAPIAWVWDENPPTEVADALRSLCADVSHLGTAESPVRLRTGEAEVTHRLDPEASLFSGDGIECEVPRPGRTSALEQAYERAVGAVPGVRSDGPGQAEEAIVAPAERSSLARARYVPLTPPVPDAPWPTVVLLPVEVAIPADRRVAWCVGLHRALVSLIGDGAPALVTGRYEAGVERPPNRLAIQYIASSIPAAPWRATAGAFALLVPSDADPADLATLERAIGSLDEVRLGPRGRIRFSQPAEFVRGDSFWAPIPEGTERVWVTDPAAIPDSRPVRGRPWTIGDAALLSVGLVLRDRFERRRARAEWYGSLVDAVRSAGADVLEAHKLNSPDGARYVHRVTPETAVQPYRAALRLGSLAGERTIIAIGQSRHLGGGLLTPLDLPAGTPPADEARGQRS
jgi:CRISPR-associated protein Csb2